MPTYRLALAFAFLPVCLAAQAAVVKDNHLKFNGKSYFKAGAESVELGSYGEKKSPLTKANYLEVQGHVARDKLKIRTATTVDIDFKNSSEKDFKVGVIAPAAGGDARVAHQIFVVLEASVATKITTSTSLSAAATNGILVVTAKATAKNEKDTAVTLSKGTTYAYLLAKMDWDKKNGDKVVEKLTDDQYSMN